MLKVLFSELKQYKKASLLTPLFTILEVIMEVIIPIITAKIIDEGIQKGEIKAVYLYGALMILVAMLSLLFGALASRFAAYASTGFACNIRDKMYKNIQTFSFSNIDKFSTAGLVTRLTTDVTNLQNAFQMILRMCTRAPFMLISALIATVLINAKMSLIFFVAIIFLSIALFIIISNAKKIFDEVFKKYDDLNASVQENVSAIRVVKAYVREDFENDKFTKAAQNLYRLFVKAESFLSFNSPIMFFAVYGCTIAISWFGANMIVVDELTTGQLTSFFSYIMNILISLMMLSMVFVMITLSIASIKRIAEVLSEDTEIKNPENPISEIKDGSISFKNVYFKYKKESKKDTLSDIDLTINSGETIGILGGTGAGKTSLVNLISRLYDVTQGEILIGGLNVKKYDLKSLRDSVAVVLQKNVLFSGTIIDNLRWGNENASIEECIHVCKLACADEFIEKFPNKYDTWIEQGGSNVSGGQKQRLCIARALLKKPKILILDDSTSAVDTATDSKIRSALKSYIPETTKIIIAQRISSIESADRIIIMDDGKINAFDTPENLLKNNKIYQEVYYSQINGKEEDKNENEK